MQEDKNALARAVNELISDAKGAQKRLDSLILVSRAAAETKVRLQMAEDPALNPILDRVFERPEALHALVKLVNERRVPAGYSALSLDEMNSKSRREYLADHMRAKRDREKRLVEAWNLMLPSTRQLRGEARAEFQKTHANRWHAAKLEREAALDRKLGRTPRKSELDDVRASFWEEVEEEIAALEAFARDEMRRGAADRNPHGFKFFIKPKDQK